jgi:hypothetical protein
MPKANVGNIDDLAKPDAGAAWTTTKTLLVSK